MQACPRPWWKQKKGVESLQKAQCQVVSFMRVNPNCLTFLYYNMAYFKSFNNDLHFLQETRRKEVLLLPLLQDPLVVETYLPVWEECCLLQVVQFLEVTSYIKGQKVWFNRQIFIVTKVLILQLTYFSMIILNLTFNIIFILQNRVLKCELETYKCRVKSLQEENRNLR